ncbi:MULTISPECIES: Lrp/AsnC family transcriptional regulator [unclassified Rhodococcus (in: high G+C Gram-positive bacteria)]|uniref:Lrp/AsnC family transcriptional regulator n=1 Tax=unclassified Rhodococcus (in: high G+C Gram-positive bacteria) TaxID=192944 RepID=UPI0007BB6797|nr:MULTISPECIES: Lrp/AsnC family transcriptional regulator [unclassified Rhodococcus (in: high G+C Gram-positive bacteria)]KZE98685.1 AsnC family transcriptional regulator [Rhodococcus sp. EPR-279]KZE99030.1 AsnC family transcriptional regulator [Rhodococcus sp. EPR-147]OZE44960.1 Lrp/AsnC family transcriptional regulator [Rhodococcus sp. 05-2254-6]
MESTLDELDRAMLAALHDNSRIGVLELSRTLGVARATVSARLQRLEDTGVIRGYQPRIGLAAAGYGVQAFVTLEIAQGALGDVVAVLEQIPGVLEAFATTGAGDVLCRVAAASHDDLQRTLIVLNQSRTIARSTSVVVLSELVEFRAMPLLNTAEAERTPKAPAYRRTRD